MVLVDIYLNFWFFVHFLIRNYVQVDGRSMFWNEVILFETLKQDIVMFYSKWEYTGFASHWIDTIGYYYKYKCQSWRLEVTQACMFLFGIEYSTREFGWIKENSIEYKIINLIIDWFDHFCRPLQLFYHKNALGNSIIHRTTTHYYYRYYYTILVIENNWIWIPITNRTNVDMLLSTIQTKWISY